MANANIQFGIKFNVDKNGLIQALKPLQQMGDYIQKMNAKKAPNAGQLAQQLGIREAAQAAKQLQKIINGSWNDKLNQLNLGKFNSSIKQSFGSVENLRKSLLKGREDGQQAFDAIASSVLNTNVQLRNANGFLDSMAKTMANTVKWGISSKIFNNLTGSIQQAYYYTKDLDRELTSIRVVTGQSADQMARFADMANRSAKNLGRSTLDYTKAALGYYQQGLDTQQVQARTEVTLKAENITGAGSQMVDYLTSVWNGFQIDTSSIQDAEAAVDKMAAVADSSASNMSQLALAMSKVAATANLMGVDMDSLVAQLATVIATTRQAPEAVGTAFKTIYTRLNDIKTGADEAQISLGNYSGQMASLGFNVLDANGRLRDTGDVIEEIGSRWNTLSKEQQTYLARIMGGQRQITQVIALFDNWTRYSELLNTSLEAQGTLDEKNAVYLDSLQGHLQKLGTEAQRTYQIFSDNDALKGITDAFTGVLNIFNDFIQGLGGGRSTILAFGAIVANVFNKQIADGLLKVNGELQRFVNNFQSKALQKKFIEDLTKNANASQNQTVEGRALQIQAKQMQQVLKISKGLTNEDYQQAISLTRKIALAEEEKRLLEQQSAVSRVRTEEQNKLLRTISVNNASQEEQLKTLKAQIENRQKQNDIYVNLQANVRRLKELELQNLTSGQRQSEIYQLLTKNRKELVNAITTQVGEEAKANALIDEIINKINRGEDVTQELYSILGTITGKLNINKEQLQIALGLQRKMTDASGQQAQKRGDLINKERSRLELLKQQAKAAINVQNFVKIGSAIAMATPSLINFFDTWADGTKTAQEKALAFSSTVTTTIGGIGSFLSTMPSMTAKVVGIGLQIVSPILGQLAKKTQDWFKTTQEKIEEFEQKVQQVNKNYSEKGKQITSLQKISEEWNVLSEKAGRYGKNVDLMSQEQQDRYYELIDTFAQYNDKVIAGYDAQGRAIIANNNVLKETIDLLKDQQWEEFTKNFGSIDKYYQNQQLLINQKQSKSENIFDSYENAVSNYGGGRKANAYERFLSNYDFINDDKVHDFLKNSGDFKYIEGKDSFKFLPETRNYLALMAPNEENFEKWKEEFLNFLTDQYNQMVKQGIFLDAENVPKLEDFQNYMLKNFFGTSDFNLESALEEFNIADPQMAALIARKKYQSFFKSLSYESEQAIYTGLQQYLNSLNKTEKGIIQTQDYEDYSKNYIEGIQDFIEKTSIDYGKINQSLEKKREQAKKLGKKFTQENEKDFIEQQVLSKIDESYWESLSPEIKDSIQAFLGSVFHYRSFEIDFSADKAQISKKSSTELKSQIAEAYQDFFAKKGQIYNIGLEKGAFRTDAISKTGFYDELAKYLDPQQLMDFDNIVNRIDWSKLSGLDTDKLGDQLRKQAQEIARQINEELNESLFTMSITEITDSKDIAEALLKPDELKKAQREVLDQILAGDEQLKSIYDKYGERSSQFIQALNARSINSIAIYEQHWKNVKNQTQDNIIEIEDSINKIFDNTRINTSGLESIIFGDKGQLLENIDINSLQEQAEAAKKAGDKDTADLYQQIISLIQQRNEELQKGIQADNESARAVAARRAQEEAIAKAAKEQADAKKELQKKQEAEAWEEIRTQAVTAKDALITGQGKIFGKDFKITSADSDWVNALIDNNDEIAKLAEQAGGDIYGPTFLTALKNWFSNETVVEEVLSGFNANIQQTLKKDLDTAKKQQREDYEQFSSDEAKKERLKDAGYTWEQYQSAYQKRLTGGTSEEDFKILKAAQIYTAKQMQTLATDAKAIADAEQAVDNGIKQSTEDAQKLLETEQKITKENLQQAQAQKDKAHTKALSDNKKERDNLAKQEASLEKVTDIYKKYLDPDQILDKSDYLSLRNLFTEETWNELTENGTKFGNEFWNAVKKISNNREAQLEQVNKKYVQSLQNDVEEIQKQYDEQEETYRKLNLLEAGYTYGQYSQAQQRIASGLGTEEDRKIVAAASLTKTQQENLVGIEKQRVEAEQAVTEELKDQTAETAARAVAEQQAIAARQKAAKQYVKNQQKRQRQQDAKLKESLENMPQLYSKLLTGGLEDSDLKLLTVLEKQYPDILEEGQRGGQAYLDGFVSIMSTAPEQIDNIIKDTQASLQANIDEATKKKDAYLEKAYSKGANEDLVKSWINIIQDEEANLANKAVANANLQIFGIDIAEYNQYIDDINAAQDALDNYNDSLIKTNTSIIKQEKEIYSLTLATSGVKTVADNLKDKKALSKEQDAFLDKLEKQIDLLGDLAKTSSRYSQNYINALRQQGEEVAKLYKEDLHARQDTVETRIKNQKNALSEALKQATANGKNPQLAEITDFQSLENFININGKINVPEIIKNIYDTILTDQEEYNQLLFDEENFNQKNIELQEEKKKAIEEAKKAREEYNKTLEAQQREKIRQKATSTRDALLTGQTKVFEADFKITSDNDDWIRDLLEGMDENDPLVQAAGEDFANIYSQAFYLELLNFFSNDTRFSGLLNALNDSITKSLNEDVISNQQTLKSKIIQLSNSENIENRLNTNKSQYTFGDYRDASIYASQNENLKNLTFKYENREISKEDFLSQWKDLGGEINFGDILADAYDYTAEEMEVLDNLADKLEDSEKEVTTEIKKQAENTQVIAQNEKQIAQSTKQRAEAQRQAAKARAEQQMSAGANAQSALQKMQTSKPGQYELTSDEGTALAFYEREVPELAKLQQGSREYQQLLAKILETRTDLVEKAKEERLTILEAEKQELLAEQEKNKAKFEQIELDKQAQNEILMNSDTTPQQGLAAQAQLAFLQGQQVEIKTKITNLDNQILAKQGEIAEVESTRVDYLQTATEKATEFNELMSKVLSSGIQMGSADQDKIVNLMDSLIQKYPELTKQAEILKQTWMAGTQQYADALRDVSQAMNDIALSEVVNKIDEEFPQFDISFIPDTDQVDAWIADLEKYLDADKELLIQVKTNADAAFEQVSGEMQRIYEAASKIGQNFIVAAKDIDVLRQTFPGILEGMQLLSDGSYQLNAQMVQDAMGTADATIQASVQSAQAQIQEQAQVAKQKATSFRSMASMARALAENEGENAEASAYIQKQLSAQVSHNKALNSKLTAQQEATNDKTVTDSQTENASLVANANVSAYQAAAEANYQYTQQVLENNKAIASSMPLGPITGFTDTGGGGGTAVKKDITNLYKSPEQAKDVTGLLADDNELLSALEDALNQTDPGERTKALLSAADNMDAQAAMWEALYQQLEAQKDALGSQYEALKQGLDNVARGVGFDPSKNKGGSGGGGKGSTPKEKTQKKPDKIDLLDEDVDRYHDINKQLKEIERTLSKVQNEQKKLFGKDLINNLNKQLKILEQQIEKQKEKAEIAKQEQEELRSTLNKQGVQFDSQGNINNYTKILEEKEKAVNDQIEKYNNMTKEEQQAQKQVVNQAKKEFEKFKKNIQKYENAQEIVQQSEENIQKALDKEIQIKISKFKMGIEIELQLGEATRQWNAFRKKVIDRINERNTRGQVQAQMADFSSYYYMRKDPRTGREHLAGQIPAATTQVQNTLQELKTMQNGGISTFYGNNVAAAMEDLKKYNDKLQEGLMAVEDIQQNIHQSVLSAIDAAKSAMDSVRSDFELISNQLDHDLKLMQMIYGEKNYEMNNDYLTRQQEINNKNLESLQKEKDIWQKLVLSSREKLSGLTEGSDEYYKELDNYTKYRDNFTNVVNQINDGITKGVELAQAKYENNVNQSLNDLEKRMTGGKGLKQLKEEWEYLNEEADRYLDKVNGMYEVNSLENSIKKAVKGYDGNIKAQQALNKLGDELLTQLREKDKLTQYDVDRANALLEIQQKRLALQDIRNNKTQLRLRRDTQGNYTFQYTANQEQTTDVEQELLTAKNRLYNLDKNAEKQEMENYIKDTQNYINRVKQFYDQGAEYALAHKDEEQRIRSHYQGLITQDVQREETARQQLQETTYQSLVQGYQEYGNSMEQAVKIAQQIMGGDDNAQVPYTWRLGLEQMKEEITKDGGLQQVTEDVFINKLPAAVDKFEQSIRNLEQASGVSFEQIKDGADSVIDTLDLILDTDSQIADYNSDLMSNTQELAETAKMMMESYQDAAEAAKQAAAAAWEYWSAEQEIAAEKAWQEVRREQGLYKNQENIPGWAQQNWDTFGKDASKGQGGFINQQVNADQKEGHETDQKRRQRLLDYKFSGYTPNRIYYAAGQQVGRSKGMNDYTSEDARIIQELINNGVWGKNYSQGWWVPIGNKSADEIFKKYGFASGGYTGNWTDSNGKLALLHQKELVLNASDTQNILAAVDIARTISDLLQTINGDTSMTGLFNMLKSQNQANPQLDQNVKIEAHFPNVTNSDEIEHAFDNLVNQASQYAFKLH